MTPENLLIVNMGIYYMGVALCGIGASWILVWLGRWLYGAVFELIRNWVGLAVVIQAVKQIRAQRDAQKEG